MPTMLCPCMGHVNPTRPSRRKKNVDALTLESGREFFLNGEQFAHFPILENNNLRILH
jgi:hypothetical protein